MEPGGNKLSREPDGRRIDWPWYVRAGEVAHVLSLVIGPVGFVLLAGLAAVLISRQGLTPGTGAVAVAAAACPLVCAAYRWWFERVGRAVWPGPESRAGDGSRLPTNPAEPPTP